jgi:hypothetical protein
MSECVSLPDSEQCAVLSDRAPEGQTASVNLPADFYATPATASFARFPQESPFDSVDGVEAHTVQQPDVKKPAFSEQQMFGLGFDVILLALAYTLAIGFVVKAIRDIADNIAIGSSRFDRFLDAIAHSEYLLPVFLGAITGPYAFDLIVRLADYSHIEPIAGVYLGICAGALSSTVAMFLKSFIKKQKEKMGLIEEKEDGE